MLVTKNDIANHREISRSVRDDKINPYIEDAELLDLKPLLGNALYFDLVKNKTDQKYQELLEPKEFTIDSETFKHVGLKKILSIFVDARYKLFGSFTDTGYGLREKNHQDSTAVSSDSKKELYKKNRQIAFQYFSDVKKFLDENSSTYPLWKKECSKKIGSGIKFSKIS